MHRLSPLGKATPAAPEITLPRMWRRTSRPDRPRAVPRVPDAPRPRWSRPQPPRPGTRGHRRPCGQRPRHHRRNRRTGSARPAPRYRTRRLLAQIGQGLLGQKKWIEAEPILRECLAIRERSQPDEWTTFNTRSLLGGSLLGQKKYAEAEPLIVSGYEGMKAREAKIPPPGKPGFTEAAERVVRLYEEWGNKEKAAEWRTKLAKPTDGTRNEP